MRSYIFRKNKFVLIELVMVLIKKTFSHVFVLFQLITHIALSTELSSDIDNLFIKEFLFLLVQLYKAGIKYIQLKSKVFLFNIVGVKVFQYFNPTSFCRLRL